jgi:hypothetical protein
VFVETLTRTEEAVVPVATPGCEKVLVRGGGSSERWPIPCLPESLPPPCLAPEALCYANASAGGYRFVPASVRDGQTFKLKREWAWPAASESRVRRLFVEYGWWDLRLATAGSRILRSTRGIERAWVYEGEARYVIVALRPEPGASLQLRVPRRMTGRIIDVEADGPGQDVRFDGPPNERWQVDLPSGPKVVVLALSSAPDES